MILIDTLKKRRDSTRDKNFAVPELNSGSSSTIRIGGRGEPYKRKSSNIERSLARDSSAFWTPVELTNRNALRRWYLINCANSGI